MRGGHPDGGRRLALRALALCAVVGWLADAAAGTVTWTFDGGDGPSSLSGISNLVAGAVTRLNGGAYAMLSAASPSAGYAGCSAGSNAVATAAAGALSTNLSTAFQFTLTPGPGYRLRLTALAFGSRGTGTGPRAFCLRSSADGFAADLAAGALETNGVWALIQAPVTLLSAAAGDPVCVRIYGADGVGGGSSNWRVDDLCAEAEAVATGVTSPPMVAQVAGQCVRVGDALMFPVTVTPTDGDPVTSTNCVAGAGVTGAWSLLGGVFRYVPAATDLGDRAFTFTASDKDGVSEPVVVPVAVRRARVPAVRLTQPAGAYAQTFDALATNGASVLWDNAAEPLEGWYAYADTLAVTAYRTGAGSGTIGGLYSFAAAAGIDRSLGSLASAENVYRFGVAFTNETGLAITNLSVRFTAEQWRAANAQTNTLACAWCATNAVLPFHEGAWRRLPSLCFASPVVTNAAQAAGPVYCSAELSASISRPILPGQVFLLRWSDEDDAGNDHAFGIDDLQVSWAAGVAPESVAVGRSGAFENFDGGASEMPFLWRVEARDDAVRVSGAYASAAERTERQGDELSNAGSYTFTSSVAGDLAVGGLSSSNAAKSVTVFAKLNNAAGQPVRRWQVRYAVEKYRNGTTACAVRLLASTDGVNWGAVGAPTAFAADGDCEAGARPSLTAQVERAVRFAAPVAAGGTFYLAWQYAVADGQDTASAQALAIDDVQITPVFPPACVMLLK